MNKLDTGGRPFDPISLSAFRFWSGPPHEREQHFEILRRVRPVSWQRPPEDAQGRPTAKPYWAILKHQDVCDISRDTASFCSQLGVQMDDVPPDIERRFVSFLDMDPPQHTQFRGLVQHAFGPKQIARMEAALQTKGREIVDRLLDRGPCDFVANVAMELPLWTICELMGVPESDRRRLAFAANRIAGRADPDYATDADAVVRSLEEIEEAGRELARKRLQQPADDLLTSLTQALIGGAKLSIEEIVSTFVVFIIGGNDNTRHTTSASMKALCDFPDQRRLLTSDFDKHIPNAIEEFLRWSTTTPTMRRTATRNRVVRDMEINEGDKVVLFYCSANRDEDVFQDPQRFDITRTPNRHLSFGGGGPHFCVGAALARMQLRTILKELLTRIPHLQVGEPEYSGGAMIGGIKRMPCHF